MRLPCAAPGWCTICAPYGMEHNKTERQKPSAAPRKEAPKPAAQNKPEPRKPEREEEPQAPQPDRGVAPGITG